MKRNSAQVMCLLLSLPCASYGVFAELIKLRSARLPWLISRAMATLSEEQRARYQDLLAQLKIGIKHKKAIITESYTHAPSIFYEAAEQELRERDQERLIFLETEKNRIEKILCQDR